MDAHRPPRNSDGHGDHDGAAPPLAPTLDDGIPPSLASGPRIGERSIGLFVGAVFALSPIGLAMFSTPQLVFGIPALAFYLFGVWALVIALLAGLASVGETNEVREIQAAAGHPRAAARHPETGQS